MSDYEPDLQRVFEANSRGLNELESHPKTDEATYEADIYSPVIDEVSRLVTSTLVDSDDPLYYELSLEAATDATVEATEGTLDDIAWSGLAKLIAKVDETTLEKPEEVSEATERVSEPGKESFDDREVRVRSLIATIQEETTESDDPPSARLLEARGELLQEYDRFMWKIANKYSARLKGTAVEVEDLYQEGAIHIINSVDGYDLSRTDAKFISYFSNGMKRKMLRYIDSHANVGGSIPSNAGLDLRKVAQENEFRRNQKRRILSDEEIAELLNVDPSHKPGQDKRNVGSYYTALRLRHTGSTSGGFSPRSDTSARDGYHIDERSPLVSLTAEPSESVEDSHDQPMTREALHEVLGKLDDDMRDVLILRFGLDGKEPRSLVETGKYLGKSREQTRKFARVAMSVLSHPANRIHLDELLKD